MMTDIIGYWAVYGYHTGKVSWDIQHWTKQEKNDLISKGLWYDAWEGGNCLYARADSLGMALTLLGQELNKRGIHG
jgi:hypothetical protein